VKDPLNYYLGDQRIPEASNCKYLGIILRSDLSWADQVNYTVQKGWNALHFLICVFKKGNSNTKSLAYMSLVRPIFEYGTSFWDPYREGQIHALDPVQKKAAKFANNTKDSFWGKLGAAQKGSSHLGPVQSIHRKTGEEI